MGRMPKRCVFIVSRRIHRPNKGINNVKEGAWSVFTGAQSARFKYPRYKTVAVKGPFSISCSMFGEMPQGNVTCIIRCDFMMYL